MASSYASLNEKEQEGQQVQVITSNGHATSPSLQETQHSPVQNGTDCKSESPENSSTPAQGPRLPCMGRRPRNPAVLILWIEEHAHNPYPSKSEKAMLAHYAGMTQRQLNDWFANARRNIKRVGYAVWKEKHPAYSACFSLGHVLRQNSNLETSEGRSSMAPTPVVRLPFSSDNTASTPRSVPVTNGLKLDSLNYGIKEEPPTSLVSVPIQSYTNTASLNHHRPFPSYFIPPQSSLMNVGTHQSTAGVGTPITMNPAAATAYYKVQPPLTSLNFRPMGQSNMTVFSPSRTSVLQPQSQFSTCTLGEISSPWTNTTLATSSNGCDTSLTNGSPAASIESPVHRTLSSPLVSEPDAGAESNSSQNESISQNVNVVTPESTWDAALPVSGSSASHQLFDYTLSTSQTHGQDIAPTNQWATTSLYQQVPTYHH